MENELKKKYGLPTAIAMVVGIVIGSGVFFKAETVLKATGGNMSLGIAAWLIVGLIMIICSYTFATMATKYQKINGVVDYAEMGVGKTYGYLVGWFMATIYTPSITSVLAWVSARYTCVLLGWDITGGSCMTIACFYLILSYAINTLSPILAGKLQVTTTVIKLIPLVIMAVVGTIIGLVNGMMVENFTNVVQVGSGTGGGLFSSIVAVAFAYEGWIIATSINSELRDSKKNFASSFNLRLSNRSCYLYCLLYRSCRRCAYSYPNGKRRGWCKISFSEALWFPWRLTDFCLCNNLLPWHS